MLGGQPIAATWCDACHNAIVYDRVVEGRTLILAPSGQLWKESMVLYDVGTHSLWCHLTGAARQGILKGKQLRRLPSVLTDWETWQRQHPDSTVVVLPHPGTFYRRDFYRDHPERFVLGIANGGPPKAWGFDSLLKTPALNTEWAGQPVLVVLDGKHFTARLYVASVGGRTLTFQMVDDKLSDRETGTTWAAATGRALAGPLAGHHLAPLPATVSYRDAWQRFTCALSEPSLLLFL